MTGRLITMPEIDLMCIQSFRPTELHMLSHDAKDEKRFELLNYVEAFLYEPLISVIRIFI